MASILSVRDEAAWPNPYLPAGSFRQARFGQPITKLVNGTFADFAATSPCFCRELPQTAILYGNFECP
jgi:hypothetical protein